MLKYKCGAAGAARAVRARSGGASCRTARRHQPTRRRSAPPAPYPRTPRTTRMDMHASTSPKSSAKAAKSAKSAKSSKTTNGCITPDGGGLPDANKPPRQTTPSVGRPGRLQADLARGARDVDGELRWRRARLRRGVRGPGRLSPQRQRRQKCAREAGEAGRAARAGVRSSAWRVGGRMPRARGGRPAASEARLVDP